MRASDLKLFHDVELQAMRLDGELVRAGPNDRDRYAAVDEPLTLDTRAALIADDVPAGFVAARATAAWVYDGLCPGRRLEVITGDRRRAPKHRRFAIDVRHAILKPADTARIGALRVTTPARTLVDLAIDRTCPDDRLEALVAWLHSAGLAPTAGELCAALRFRKGGVAARGRLGRLVTAPARDCRQLVTRYTS